MNFLLNIRVIIMDLTDIVRKSKQALIGGMALVGISFGAFSIPANAQDLDAMARQAWRDSVKAVRTKEQAHADTITVLYNTSDYTVFNGNGFTHEGTIEEFLTVAKTLGLEPCVNDAVRKEFNPGERYVITGFDRYIVFQKPNASLSQSKVLVNFGGAIGTVLLTAEEMRNADNSVNLYSNAEFTRHKLLEQSFPGTTYRDNNGNKFTYGLQDRALVIEEDSDYLYRAADGTVVAKKINGNEVIFYDYGNDGILDRTIETDAFGFVHILSEQDLTFTGTDNMGDECNPEYVTTTSKLPWDARQEVFTDTLTGMIDKALEISERYTATCNSCYGN